MSKPKPGERVKAASKNGVFEGVVLPRPDTVSGDDVILKLDSGYNIGLLKAGIKELVTLTSKKRKTITPQPAAKKTAGKPSVSILSTGGTIASKIDYTTGGVSAAFTLQELLQSAPEIQEHANITSRAIMNVMSEDMNPSLWVRIAHEVHRELEAGASGVVVTHGTDTMHYTAAALNFLLPNCPKPVILTGSQRSTDRGSSDAFQNLVCSVIAAAGDLAGAYIVMHGSLQDEYCLAHNGTRVRKMHTTRRDAFKSINSEPVAKITPNGSIELLGGEYRKRGEGVLKLDAKIESKVGFVKAYPGMPPKLLDFYVKNGARGVVIEGTALGHVPTTIPETTILPSIEAAINKGVVVCMTSQCLFGRVHPLVYSNLRELSSRGVVFCGDMLPETVYVKLMWVLGRTNTPQAAAKLMLENIAGELSDRSAPTDDFIP